MVPHLRCCLGTNNGTLVTMKQRAFVGLSVNQAIGRHVCVCVRVCVCAGMDFSRFGGMEGMMGESTHAHTHTRTHTCAHTQRAATSVCVVSAANSMGCLHTSTRVQQLGDTQPAVCRHAADCLER